MEKKNAYKIKKKIIKEVNNNRNKYKKNNNISVTKEIRLPRETDITREESKTEELVKLKVKQEERVKEHERSQKWKNYLFLLAGLLLLAGIIFLIVLKVNTGFKVGEYKKKVELNYGTPHNLKSPEVCYGNFIECKDIKPAIKGDYDVNSVGEYKLEYDYKHKDKHYKIKQTVIVKDLVEPEITVNEETINICPSGKILNLEVTANDNVDGDLTLNVNKELNGNKLLLSVKDSSGNTGEKEIEVKLEDKEEPTITLNGNESITIATGSQYNEQGASALDSCDGEVKVDIDGNVDTSNEGEYLVSYSAIDSSGNKKTITRKVIVKTKIVVPRNVYLTFDDGPGPYTQELLDLLDKYGVKVTFFVTNQFPKYQYLIAEEAKRGHTVAVHTLTHKFDIYTSVDTYRADFNAMNDIIEQQTGSRSKYFRFPGGSSNTVSKKYAKGVVLAIRDSMVADGFRYYDWNVDSNDAAGAGTEKAYKNVINGVNSNLNSVVLMHDIHKTSIPAVEKIIQYGLENGYVFKAIDDDTPQIHHGIRN